MRAPLAQPSLVRSVTLGSYSTYFVTPGRSTESPAERERIRASLESTLADKAWIEVTPEDAQVAIVIHVATPAAPSLQAMYAGWGGWSWQQGDGNADLAASYPPGTAVVDFFDAQRMTLLWRGVAPGLVESRNGRLDLARAELDRLIKAIPGSGYAAATTAAPDPTPAPNIVFTSAPVTLVLVYGEPTFTPVSETTLARVVNTRSFILRDTAGMFYLRVAQGWMSAYALIARDWSPTNDVPDGAEEAFQRAVAANDVTVPGRRGTSDATATTIAAVDPPTILVSTQPVSIVVVRGDPQFEPVAGTSLQRMTNADTPLFREPTDGQLYLRLPGGWFRAWSTGGRWESIPDGRLPGDLTTLPPTLLHAARPIPVSR